VIKNRITVYHDNQVTGGAGFYPGCEPQLLLYRVAQADRRAAKVPSKETTLDNNFHESRPFLIQKLYSDREPLTTAPWWTEARHPLYAR
jgi:hypothetical protein